MSSRAHDARVKQQDLAVRGYAPLPVVFHFADAVVPDGVINGVNDTFTLPDAPNPAESLVLFSDKVLQIQGVDYTLNVNRFVITVPPAVSLLAFYRY